MRTGGSGAAWHGAVVARLACCKRNFGGTGAGSMQRTSALVVCLFVRSFVCLFACLLRFDGLRRRDGTFGRVLKAAVGNGPQQLRLEQKVFEA
jgi:hypothetical protein